MNLEERLLAEHTKTLTLEIVQWVGDDQKKFDELFHVFMNADYRVVQRSAWPLGFCVIAHPRLIAKHYPKIFKKLEVRGQHPAVQRNILKIFAGIEHHPPKYHGRIMDACFRFIEDPGAPVAVQSYSLHVLAKLCRAYPDIAAELALIIETRLPNATPAFKAAAKKFFKMNEAGK